MSKPHNPPKPEERVRKEITISEYDLIVELRRKAYGKFKVHKQDNRLVRVEATESVLLGG